jgi:hypothetical protein
MAAVVNPKRQEPPMSDVLTAAALIAAIALWALAMVAWSL